MDIAIKYVIQKKYNDYIKIIESTDFSIDELKNIYHFFLWMMSHNYMTDNDVYICLGAIIQRKIKRTDYDEIINNIPSDALNNVEMNYNFITHYKKSLKSIKKYDMSYKLIRINEIHHVIKLRLIIVILNFINATGIIQKNMYNITLNKFYDIINTKIIPLIEYYKDPGYIKQIQTACKKDMHKCKKNIQKRLIYLVNYIGVDLLKFMGVRVITNRKYIKLSYKMKVFYYKSCIISIYKFIECINVDYSDLKKTEIEINKIVDEFNDML
uniref:Uncharacterized protein n=1 Tax=Mimivirus LCMiAC01 TaxID=2506608 RepID=A0A481YZT0_9VIRU|nr:MAG: hypothetical protein LCMiAC01_04350 [Mimivirus LCMiAC01]